MKTPEEKEIKSSASAAPERDHREDGQHLRGRRNPRIVIGNLDYFLKLMEEEERL